MALPTRGFAGPTGRAAAALAESAGSPPLPLPLPSLVAAAAHGNGGKDRDCEAQSVDIGAGLLLNFIHVSAAQAHYQALSPLAGGSGGQEAGSKTVGRALAANAAAAGARPGEAAAEAEGVGYQSSVVG